MLMCDFWGCRNAVRGGARWCLANGIGGINGSWISFGHRLGASRRLRKWGGL